MQIRDIPKDDLPVAARVFETALGEELGDHSRGAWMGYLEMSHNVGAYLDDRLVGTATQFAAQLTVPGRRSVPVHAVTGVGVLPTHTRRGAARALMERQFDVAADDGAVALVLEASEGGIYGRFGYGPATIHQNVAIQADHLRLREPLDDDGRFEFVDVEDAHSFAGPLYDQWRLTRIGQLDRPVQLWGLTLVDPPEWRGGGGSLQWVFHVDASGTPDGYIAHRIVTRWDEGLPAAEAKVIDLVAADPRVRLLLLQYAADIDLVAFVTVNGLPVDDPLHHALVDPRRLRVADQRDGLWVRIIDLPGAMVARRWYAEDTLVVEVDDPDRADVAGRWRLAVANGEAAVERTEDPADVRLGVAELGMLWLGGVTAGELVHAGRLQGSPRAVERATLLFRGIEAPHHVGEF